MFSSSTTICVKLCRTPGSTISWVQTQLWQSPALTRWVSELFWCPGSEQQHNLLLTLIISKENSGSWWGRSFMLYAKTCQEQPHLAWSLHVFTCWCLQDILDGLSQKNHLTEYLTSTGAVVQAVVRYDKGLHAQSDPRKWAYAAGYWGHEHTCDYAEQLELCEPWHHWYQTRD